MILDLGSTEQIQRWFARADSGITVSTSPNQVGLQNVTLSLDEEIIAPYVRLFFAVLAVVTLREETITRDVAPLVGILRKWRFPHCLRLISSIPTAMGEGVMPLAG